MSLCQPRAPGTRAAAPPWPRVPRPPRLPRQVLQGRALRRVTPLRHGHCRQSEESAHKSEIRFSVSASVSVSYLLPLTPFLTQGPGPSRHSHLLLCGGEHCRKVPGPTVALTRMFCPSSSSVLKKESRAVQKSTFQEMLTGIDGSLSGC